MTGVNCHTAMEFPQITACWFTQLLKTMFGNVDDLFLRHRCEMRHAVCLFLLAIRSVNAKLEYRGRCVADRNVKLRY